mgnify:CR=1 FL=1
MRADRLISLVLLLQTRGRMTARELADELEVTERTIYRDVIALSSAGIPLYTDRGPGGGIALLDSYRTTLTGLSEDEAAALFMLSIPAPLEALGVGNKLRDALLKLSAALPASRREAEQHTRQRIHLDSVPWFQGEQHAPFLAVLQQALWQDCRVDLTYESGFGAQIQAVVEPLGLAAKVHTWYLVYRHETAIKVLPVRRVIRAQPLTERFNRPADFDLILYWKQWVAENEAFHVRYPVLVRVAPEFLPILGRYLPDITYQLADEATGEYQEWRTLHLYFDSLEAARGRLLGLGRAVEVVEPLPLRLSLLDFAEQIVDFYHNKTGQS